MIGKAVTFLLVEDDEVDLMMLKRSFQALRIANPVTVARHGKEALQMLRGEAGHEKILKPYIILLDLNMPVMSGLEFLDVIRDDQDLHASVVFVLTTSAHDEDKASAYAQNVAGYIVKSDPGGGFMDAIKMIDHYWKVVELP